MSEILDYNELPSPKFSKKSFNHFVIALILFILNIVFTNVIASGMLNSMEAVYVMGFLSALILFAYVFFNIRGIYFGFKSMLKKEPNSVVKVVGIIGNLVLVIPFFIVDLLRLQLIDY